MSTNYQQRQMPDGEKFNPMRLGVFILALGLLGFIAYRYYFAEGAANYTNIPKEVQG
jgi:hypothetical protein